MKAQKSMIADHTEADKKLIRQAVISALISTNKASLSLISETPAVHLDVMNQSDGGVEGHLVRVSLRNINSTLSQHQLGITASFEIGP